MNCECGKNVVEAMVIPINDPLEAPNFNLALCQRCKDVVQDTITKNGWVLAVVE